MNWGGFHALSNFWLLALLVPVVLFYFLKLKRPRLEIPSLALWQQVLRDNRVNSPFQRFKRNLLLLLQLLLLLFLILAALQPYWRGRASAVRRLPVLVDCSASMGAFDQAGGAARLAEVKRRINTIIDGLAGDQQLCLISFSRAARKRTGFTDDKRLLREALAQIEVENVPSDLEEALRLVQALARSEPFDEVMLFSDGNLPARANFDLSFKLNYQRLAPGGVNLGITALSARRSVAGGWDVFVQIEGTAETEGNGDVELWDGDASVAQERFTLVKGRAQRMVFRFGGEKTAALRVQLTPDAFDSLAADNVAHLDLPAMRSLRVYVPPALTTYRHALRAMSGVAVSDNAAGDFDLAITDQTNDVAVVARTRLWVGLTPPELQGLVGSGTNMTQVVDWRRDSPLLQHVELSDLLVLDDPAWAGGVREGDFENVGYEVIAHGEHGPLVVEKRADDAHTVALLFHTDRSTLPYRVGFPIFVANVVQVALEREGLAEAHGARSLLSPNETSLASVEQLQFNERLSVAAAGAPLKTDRALWKWMVFAALGLLVGEWWYFNRKPGGFR